MNRLFLLIFVPLTISRAGTPDSLLEKGDSLFLSSRFNQALTLLDSLILQHPEDPALYCSKARIYQWLFFGSQDEYFADLFNSNAQKAVELFEKQPKLTQKYRYFYGRLYMQMAAMQGYNGAFFGAYLNAREAVSEFEDLIEKNAGFAGPYLGLGLMKYSMDSLPGMVKFFSGIAGLDADPDAGLSLLLRGVEKGGTDITETFFYAGKIYSDYLAENDSAEIFLQKITDKFPDNQMFRYQLAIVLFRKNNYPGAENNLRKILDSENNYLPQTRAYAWFTLGDIFFRQNQFEKAAACYKSFFKNTTNLSFTGIANLRIAQCYFMIGNKSEAKKHLILVDNGNIELPEDQYAVDTGARLFNEGMDENAKLILKLQNITFFHNDSSFSDNISSLAEEGSPVSGSDLGAIINARIKLIGKDFHGALDKLGSAGKSQEYHTLVYLMKAKIFLKLNLKQKALEMVETAGDNEEDYNEFILPGKINQIRKECGF